MLKDFWKSIDKVLLGSITALVLLVINILCWVFNAETAVPMWLYIITILVMYICCIVVYAMCSAKKESVIYRLPAVLSIYKDTKSTVFIVEKNDLFIQGSYATICFQDDEDSLETVLGLGYVQSINSSGYFQIVMEKISRAGNAEKIYKKIENTASYRKSIKIKPSIHKELFEEETNDG